MYICRIILTTQRDYPLYHTIDTENINPFTGKFVDYQNKEITENASSKLEYSDIDGHYAEKYIKRACLLRNRL